MQWIRLDVNDLLILVSKLKLSFITIQMSFFFAIFFKIENIVVYFISHTKPKFLISFFKQKE